jgi:hypothetical protein
MAKIACVAAVALSRLDLMGQILSTGLQLFGEEARRR